MNFAVSGGSAHYGHRNRRQGACNIHHLKGFGICVRRNRGEIDGGPDSRSHPLRVENAASLFSQ